MVQERKQGATALSDFLVRQWTRVERHFSSAPQYFDSEGLLVAWRQGFESSKKLGCMPTHNSRLAEFPRRERGP